MRWDLVFHQYSEFSIKIFSVFKTFFIKCIVFITNWIHEFVTMKIYRVNVLEIIMCLLSFFVENLLSNTSVAPIHFQILSRNHQNDSNAGLNEHCPSKINRIFTILSHFYGFIDLCFCNMFIFILLSESRFMSIH